MTSVCVISNSHAAALKRAWPDLEKEFSNIQLTFFAARGYKIRKLAVDGSRLIPPNEKLARMISITSQGLQEIDVNNFDSFLIYALGVTAYIRGSSQYYSSAAIRTALSDHVSGTASFEILQKLRSITEKPVYIGHDPLPSASGESGNSDNRDYESGIEMLNREIYRRFNAEMVKQPAITIIDNKYTHPGYSKGSKRLEIGEDNDSENHPEHDRYHMNEEYGKYWLRQFFMIMSSGRTSAQ